VSGQLFKGIIELSYGSLLTSQGNVRVFRPPYYSNSVYSAGTIGKWRHSQSRHVKGSKQMPQGLGRPISEVRGAYMYNLLPFALS
jgi:hypothetical protein